MTMMKIFGTRAAVAAAGAMALLALPAVGDAQTRGSNQPVAYGADGVEYAPNRVILRGRAEAVQGGNRFRADQLTLVSGSGGDLERAEAAGSVYFVTPEQTMRGDRAVYNLGSGEIVVTGNVILTQGQNVLSGSRLVYNVNTQTARMEGAPRGAAGNRVQGVFYPNGTN
ncbi:organic solvent tolerance protein OstA [Brevundimonas sp. DS20]|jgi:lipopolysaccharide export system protein LptA|nr:organic solvent tolerance protein OstA [Brevundimonas sp. DS20]